MLPTEQQIIDLLKPALDHFATGENRAIILEMHANGEKTDNFRVGMWDTKNSVYHYGTTFSECQEAKSQFDPELIRLAEIAELESRLAALKNSIAMGFRDWN
jgi:hypothetical protein